MELDGNDERSAATAMKLCLSFFCLLAAIFISAGCRKLGPGASAGKFGPSWNEHRVPLGLRLIPSDSILRNPGRATGEHWIMPVSPGSGTPRWGGKEIEMSNGTPTVETDIFYGPSFNDPAEGPTEAVLRIGYDYRREKQAGQNPWAITVHDGKSFMRREVSLEEAKRILTTWGLAY